MKSITSIITHDREFEESVKTLAEQLAASEPLPIAVNGLAGGAAYAYVAETVKRALSDSSAPVLVLAGSDKERDALQRTLAAAGVSSEIFSQRDLVFHNISASHETERERLSVLLRIASGESFAIVTTPDAAIINTVPSTELLSLVTTLRVGTLISPDELCEKLLTLGFARVDTVEGAGQFARRGGIVDFAVNDGDDPIRVEFFGDEIDRIVSFDIMSQRARARLDEVRLSPAIEVMMSSAARERVVSHIERLAASAAADVKTTLSRELSALCEGMALECRDKYLSIIYEKRECLLDYFTSAGGGAVLLFGTAETDASLDRRLSEVKDAVGMLIEAGLLSAKHSVFTASREQYSAFLARHATVHVNAFAGTSSIPKLAGLFGFRTRRCVNYGGNPSMLIEDLRSYLSTGYRVVLASANKKGAEAVVEDLAKEGISAHLSVDGEPLIDGVPVTVTVSDSEGYDLIAPRIALLSLTEDVGRRIMRNRRQQRILKKSGGAGQRIMSYAELEVGDYVVHANYGIGLFEGIESVRVDGVTKDYITIRYAGTDKLFVPCDRLEMIGKYIGARESDGTVKLSKMGGAEWHKAKTRAKSAVKDIAEKLIRLYAERKRTPGFAFPPDTELEEQFAAGFEYIETDSQLAAIDEIKRDMMDPAPMNRLLCGDVGFGKTEVALRAAFKAIMGGKQVAILVPTTILALQHYQTALSRMRGYPVEVEMLSRFKTPKQQADILKRLAEGRIDILIGTHKLLGKKIEFRDLGLLIIDEEQRFGVAQKEKLKEIATNVDTLTLSATPIPRTLNMAINGISDMSVLDEAPENRRPVQTYVLEHDEIVINDAIRRELSRGGQALYLYNNIETIDYVADKIAAAVPEARVAYAHGRMEKEELEDIWQSLVRGEIDVLVCTTIIETGVDLPSANTLIIENADRMGLSQLHQLRGRVGRSERQAYAYFTYRPGKALTDIAKKRLAAIKEYAEFGAGFKVALCDLEIRGAGNILGAEQHGYIDSVGYDLYVKLLSEAVLTERGETVRGGFESTIDFKVDAHIPEYYIESSAQRMEIYKKISHISSADEMDDLYDEITDRFGTVPRSVERLLGVAFSRAAAERARIPRVELKGTNILFYTDKPDLSVWSMVLQRHKGQLIGTSDRRAPIVYRLKSGEDPVRALVGVFRDYCNEMNS